MRGKSGALPPCPPAAGRSRRHSNKQKAAPELGSCAAFCGRSDRTRTCSIVLPKHARYQLRHTSIFSFVFHTRGTRASCCRDRILLRKCLCSHSATAATPYCSLYPPPAALANVPNCATPRYLVLSLIHAARALPVAVTASCFANVFARTLRRLPLLIARCIRHWRRSQTSPIAPHLDGVAAVCHAFCVPLPRYYSKFRFVCQERRSALFVQKRRILMP